MNDKEDWHPIMDAMIGQLRQGQITEDMYRMACQHPDEFKKIGLNADYIKQLLETKAELTFCPDPGAYSIISPNRINYLYKHAGEPDIESEGKSEECYLDALQSYFTKDRSFKEQLKNIALNIDDSAYQQRKNLYDVLVNNEATRLIAGLLVKKDFPVPTSETFGAMQLIFDEYELHDVYNMADNAILLQWKAALAAVSRGLLDVRMAEVIFMKNGFDIEKLKKRIERFQTDKLRVSQAELITPIAGTWYSIHCRVDGQEQEDRVLSAKDTERLNPLVDPTGLAVTYFQDVLDANREQNKAVANEKVLARMKIPSVERLADISRNGLNTEDVILLTLSKEMKKDPFWWDAALQGMENESVDVQKRMAFEKLACHIDKLQPDILSDEEVIGLTRVFPPDMSPKREGEENLMKLPEFYFPLIEQSGAHNSGVVNYVKAIRDFGRITPGIAYHSMEYFLRNRLDTAWDPEGAKDEYGRTVGCNYYPNKDMKNPSEMFPANLLSERQWGTLFDRYLGEADELIPYGAFKKDRVSEVQIYSQDDGKMIRCKVDGIQQGGRRLSITDEVKINENTDKQRLAVGYFEDAFATKSERSTLLMR